MTELDIGWPDFEHEDACPACGRPMTGLANTTDLDPPQPGDPIVCIECQVVNVMGDDGRVRHATNSEAFAFAMDPDINRVIWAMKQLGPPPSGSDE